MFRRLQKERQRRVKVDGRLKEGRSRKRETARHIFEIGGAPLRRRATIDHGPILILREDANGEYHFVFSILYSKMTSYPAAVTVNLSSLLFREASTDDTDKIAEACYTGPIRVVTSRTSNAVAVAHGRGVVATRDIQAGECLFVTPPVVTANVEQVTKLWKERVGSGSSENKLVEQLSEQVLVQEMERVLRETPDKARTFLALMGASDSDVTTTTDTSMECLLGNADKEDVATAIDPTSISQEDLRQIVRRNAFGPDFRTFDYIERRWRQDAATDTTTDAATCGTEGSFFLPTRLLGMYPLAAMLNHSCVPNAVRVFTGEIMVAHANANISAGEEIVWSYLPPTQPYPVRSDTLKNQYGFECHCQRCVVEEAAWKGPCAELLQESCDSLAPLNRSNLDTSLLNQGVDVLESAVQKLQDDILGNVSFSNELRRYLRVGYMHLYINYLNAALAAVPNDNANANDNALDAATATKERLVGTCMELHFAFCECHNASTEHLSILHLCYELVGSVHTTAADQTKTLPKLKFWTEQIRRAIMIRYGSLGNDLDSVRKVMQHTRTVLRNRDGMESVKYHFI